MAVRRIAATLLLWAGMGEALPAAAQTSCDAAHRFTLDWSAMANADLDPGASYSYAVVNAAGDTRTVTVSFDGDTSDFADIGFRQTPYIGSYYTGGLGGGTKTLVLGAEFDAYQSNIDSTNDAIVTTFAFDAPVRDVAFSVFDIDYDNNRFRDWVKLTGANGAAAYGPFLSTPFDPDGPPPNQSAGSTVFLGPYAPGGLQAISASEAVGNGASDIDQNDGTMNVLLTQPITEVQLRYANGPDDYMNGRPRLQGIGVHNISFCPMPELVITKTVAPLQPSGVERFAVPAADMVYTINVANTGGSTVDLDSLSLTDLIPAGIDFYNGDFDPAVPGMGPFQFTAGGSSVSCCTGAVSFASGTPTRVWGYAPATGYDGSVTGISWSPAGTMAANSSFSIRFRVRID
jgi:uncharacterized repeat protein (TIGR01451 family)